MIQDFFGGIFGNFLAVFRGKNLLFHALAIGLTAAFVFSGLDWRFFEMTRSELFHPLIWAAGIGGFFIPVLVPVGVYLIGEYKKSRTLIHMGAAVGQAVILAYVVSIIYKAFTGRIEPEFLAISPTIDTSHNFNFGFLEYGVFWGWPSSHTAVAFAGAFVVVFLSQNKAVRILALLYALCIGVGAAIGFHWLSDVVAGGIIGVLVGSVVAKNFRNS